MYTCKIVRKVCDTSVLMGFVSQYDFSHGPLGHSPHVLLSEAGPDEEPELTGAQMPRRIHYFTPPHGLPVVFTDIFFYGYILFRCARIS